MVNADCIFHKNMLKVSHKTIYGLNIISGGNSHLTSWFHRIELVIKHNSKMAPELGS